MKMIKLNTGMQIGGPWDGKVHSCLIYPGDYPNDCPPKEVSEVRRVFSKNFPEGAVYLWNSESKEWRYAGSMDEAGQKRCQHFLGVLGVEPI